jgi:hypothetical protein
LKIAQDEWDFRSLPEKQTLACFCYEYMRQLWQESRIKTPVDFREMVDILNFEKELQEPSLNCFCQEWPKTAFLSLRLETRCYLVERFRLSYEPLGVCDLTDLRGWPHFFPIQIDWTRSDTDLIEAFRRFLKEQRKKLSVSSMKAVSGRGSIEKRCKTALFDLGVYRLLEALSPQGADIESQRVYGHPIYDSPSAWSRAKGRAKKRLRTLCSLTVSQSFQTVNSTVQMCASL